MAWRALSHFAVAGIALFTIADLEHVPFAFHGGRVASQLLACCTEPPPGKIAPRWAPSPSTSTEWMPVVDSDGKPFPAGHKHDAYYVGEVAREPSSTVNSAYSYRDTPRLSVSLKEHFHGIEQVSFPQFAATSDGALTDAGLSQAINRLKMVYGPSARIQRLGEGGFQVVFLVSPPKGRSVVAKVRKIRPSVNLRKRAELLLSASFDLRRDLAMEVVADLVTSRGRYAQQDGSPVPLRINGGAVRLRAPPSVRLARVATTTNHPLLEIGIVEQEQVRFDASEALTAYLAQPGATQRGWRASALAAAREDPSLDEAALKTFLEKFKKPSRFGPDVIKIDSWLRACRTYRRLSPIKRLCNLARHSFNIPDDFDDRLVALEQLYRDSAADVIRYHRHNFADASGNDATDGQVREVGLDFNHGRNAGWDPGSAQFVLFDW